MVYLPPRTLKLHKGLACSMTEYPNQILLEHGLEFGDSIEARKKPLAHAKAVAASCDELIEKVGYEK